MNRRNFIYLLGCGCLSFGFSSCSTVPITERRQIKIIPESHINAKASKLYEKIQPTGDYWESYGVKTYGVKTSINLSLNQRCVGEVRNPARPAANCSLAQGPVPS